MSAREVVVRAALAKWFADRIGDVRKGLAVEAKDAMDVGDRKKAVLEDGTVIGSVTITDPKWLPKVIDVAALHEWVRENAPTEIEQPPAPPERVRPAFVAALLGKVVQVAADTAILAADPDTGEFIPGVVFERRDPNATVTVTPEQADAIQVALDDGRLADAMHSLTTPSPKEIER